MFETILIRRSDIKGQSIDPGLIAEALLFYQNVHLLLDHPSLTALLKNIGPDNLFYLIDSGFLKATYVRQALGTQTTTKGGVTINDFGCFEFVGNKEKGILKRKDRIEFIFERTLGKSSATRKAARKFCSKVALKDINAGIQHPSGITGLARDDLNDPRYVRRAIELAISDIIPIFTFPNDWEFNIAPTDDGFIVGTDLNFVQLGKLYNKLYGGNTKLTPALFLNYILESRADICFASQYLSEIVTTSTSSKIMELKFINLLEKKYKNAHDIEIFQKINLGNARAIRQAINSGEREFGEFIAILEKATKFKHWLKNVHPDEGLLEEYYRTITASTWADNLPTKSIRFAVCTAGGLLIDAIAPTGLGTAAGVTLGAADSFIIDRFLKGWKPNQFIEDLGEFVEKIE